MFGVEEVWSSEDECKSFLRIIGTYLPNYTASHWEDLNIRNGEIYI
jgi:hypothetical protein